MALRRRHPPAVYIRRRIVALLALAVPVAIAVALVAHSGGRPSSRARIESTATPSRPRPLNPRTTSEPVTQPPKPTPKPKPSLPLSQLAGQRIIYAYPGLYPPPSLLTAVHRGEAAGVILFGSNVSSASQVHAAAAALQQASLTSPLHAPLLILTDQEGGEVRRLPGAPELSQQEIGESPDAVQLAGEAGAGAAGTLADAGINVNLSPVLDVARDPDGFIGEFHRSYGGDPARVARLGRAFIAGQQRAGVIATAKHFPGLGAAGRGHDTDSRPVTLDLSVQQLRSVDEAPYRAAISAGVKIVMTSWAIYPALDPSLPAGLSARVIEGELRDRLGYRGVTISDTLSAGALTPYGSLARRGVLAARAGADLIICSATSGQEDPSVGVSVRKAIAAAIGDGQLSRTTAERAAARVLALRRSLRVSRG